ncbi:MAG: OB-fold nucleic acid binding domain-containing protein, partial [Candidatus Dormibacteria bacterium]
AESDGGLTAPPGELVPSPEAQRERLLWERELLGMYLSQHPLQQLGDRLRESTDTEVVDLGRLEGRLVQVAGSLRECRRVQNRKGEAMAFASLEDLSGVCEVVIFPKVFQRAVELLHPDGVVVVRGRVEVGPRPGAGRAPSSANGAAWSPDEEGEEPAEEAEEARVIAEDVLSLDDPQLADWRADSVVHVSLADASEDVLAGLAAVLVGRTGASQVVLHLQDAQGRHEIELGGDHRVDPGPDLERAVSELCGRDSYRVETIRATAPVPNSQRFRQR